MSGLKNRLSGKKKIFSKHINATIAPYHVPHLVVKRSQRSREPAQCQGGWRVTRDLSDIKCFEILHRKTFERSY